ncbi:hypothetical protein C8R44DRAFT_759693 [Mycena epipterygia]|nr:hypothetical protein C8R44DRAFT_759693 [Mycena epipterygia]
MSFILNGTHIDGGTFNNVSGNMTQVFNSHVSQIQATSAGLQKAGTTQTLPRIGTINIDGVSRHRNVSRSAISGRRDDQHESHRNNTSTFRGIRASRDTIAPAVNNPIPMSTSNNRIQLPKPQERNPCHPITGPGNNETIVSGTNNATWSNSPDHNATASIRMSSDHRMMLHQPLLRSSEPISNNTYSIGGGMTQLSVTSYGESGINILYRSVVMEALHDSGERFPEPACYPGTRTAVLDHLKSWSVDMGPESTFLWLHGSAGVGKSAIAQMFAGECHRQRRLGGSFFFRRGHQKRGTWHGLITTIAYQLAHSVPEFLLPLQQAVDSDKLVVGRAMAVQFQRLLVEPFNHTPALQIIPVIVLDGLDECEDHKVQQQILCLFIGAIRDHKLPIRIIVTSRPEPHLRDILEAKQTLTICRPLALSADESAYDDIRTYLREEFSRIHSDYWARGLYLGDRWPAPDALDHLVRKSSGIFIYATTVIRFVDDEYSHPADRLASVLSLDPLSTAPFDDLYTEILSVLPQESEQLRILHVIWRGTIPNGLLLDQEEIDMVLELRPGTGRLVLHALHSLFHVPIRPRFQAGYSIGVLHASLPDYLGDSRRSKGWCVSEEWLASDYLHCLIRVLSAPPPTDSARTVYFRVVDVLPAILQNTTPSAHLFGLLRNPDFQNSIFVGGHTLPLSILSWPQGSAYPSDLVQLWEDHRYVFALLRHLTLSRDRTFPTFKFDPVYKQILSKRPDTLFLLKTLIVEPHDSRFLAEVLRFLGGAWNYRALQPFAIFRAQLILPFPNGDSPIDFLNDPSRAGVIYSEPQTTAEELVLLWIHRAKEFLIVGGCFYVAQ